MDRLESTRHVGSLGDRSNAVVEESFRVVSIQFILGRGRKGQIHRYGPGALFSMKLCRGKLLRVLVDPASPSLFEIFQPGELVGVDPVRVVDEAFRV